MTRSRDNYLENRRGDDRWYEINVPLADRLYDEHLEQLRKEGLIDGYEICRTARKDGA